MYLHYSGHGSYVRDISGDEKDGRDECLVPIDYMKSGMILDDELRGLLQCLDEKKSIFMVLDCCHSGTGMDLCYNLYEQYSGKNLRMIRDSRSGSETRGRSVMLSGCRDSETSADAYLQGGFQGALTHAFLEAIEDKKSRTFAEMIRNVKKILKEGKFSQRPNLSSGKNLNLNTNISL